VRVTCTSSGPAEASSVPSVSVVSEAMVSVPPGKVVR
jgi:hypothetical protein